MFGSPFRRSRPRSLDGWKRAVSAVLAWIMVVTLFAGTIGPAGAIGIAVTYDPTIEGAVDPCAEDLPACDGGVDRTEDLEFLIQVAAAYYATIFHDAHNLEIRFAWIMDDSPSASVVDVDDVTGKPLEAIMRIPADIGWFYDPTPFDDEEFNMQPKLYRATHPHEQGEAFNGSPPEVFEVGYNGEAVEDIGPDLLTVIFHEMGHVLGLASQINSFGPEPACSQEDPYYHIDPALVGGATMSLKAYASTGEFPIGIGTAGKSQMDGMTPTGHIDEPVLGYDCQHLALGGIKECGDDAACKRYQALMWTGMLPNARSRPGTADILALATAAGWEEIHLPRKFSVASGLWNDGATWIGNRIPNAGNNVYIVNQEEDVSISLYDGGAAREVLISDGNDLQVTFLPLDLYRLTATGEGTSVGFDSGALLDTVYVDVGAGSMLDLANGAQADIFWTLTNQGTIRGGGESEIEVHTLDNRGTIRANGESLTIASRQNGPALDLDGVIDWPHTESIEALYGDLIFDGIVTDPVAAAISVGDGHSITFSDGWEQQYTNDPATTLQLLGASSEAVVHGETTLNGFVEIDGTGRFTANTTFGPLSQLGIGIGGLEPGAGYDRVIVDQQASLSGALNLSLTDGFTPAPNDSFVIMTYGSRAGEFSQVTGWDLGDMRLYLEYDETELRVVARQLGDVNGDGEVTNKDISALAKSFGPCPADSIPCPGDLDADGDIDPNDLQMLLDILH